VNVTLVKGDAYLMVDTGVRMGGAYRELRHRMAAEGIGMRDVQWIALTHCHWDHINAAGAAQAESGARLAAGAADVPFIEDRERNFRGFLADFGVFTREVFPYPLALLRCLKWIAWGRQPTLTVDQPLAEGDVLDLGRRVRAVPLPGHTTGHTGYYVADAGVLVLGDLIDFANAHGMDLNNPQSDYASALVSLETAIGLQPEVIIPAHGEPTVGQAAVRDVLERALTGGRAYPEQIRRALGSAPLRLKAITHAVFPDIPFSMEAMTTMLVLVVLLYMEKSGGVERRAVDGRPAWVRCDG
jgi:glyoxylase-like metal-dependent hydrolase (beta-lactamase superfamily II)